jgi:hypothetical protein
MASMPQSKETEKQIGLKHKAQSYVAHKRNMSLRKTNTGLQSKGGKRFSRQVDPINGQE